LSSILTIRIVTMLLVATGDNIRKLRKELHLSQQQLADKSGVGRSAIAQYEAGRNEPPLDVARKLAEVLNVSPAELLDLSSPQNLGLAKMTPVPYTNLGREVPVARTGFRFVPIYGAITAGLPSASYSDVLDWIELPEWGGDFQRWGRVIEGESMAPEFEPEDVAIFEERQWVHGDGVHAFKDGEDVFKIAWVENGKTTLRPINPGFPDIDAKGWKIKGVCIKRVREQGRGVTDTRDYRSGFKWRDF
jgi:transcriptional regulator with XRE-family HTH domain